MTEVVCDFYFQTGDSLKRGQTTTTTTGLSRGFEVANIGNGMGVKKRSRDSKTIQKHLYMGKLLIPMAYLGKG